MPSATVQSCRWSFCCTKHPSNLCYQENIPNKRYCYLVRFIWYILGLRWRLFRHLDDLHCDSKYSTWWVLASLVLAAGGAVACTMTTLFLEQQCVMTCVGGLEITLGMVLSDPRWSVGGIQWGQTMWVWNQGNNIWDKLRTDNLSLESSLRSVYESRTTKDRVDSHNVVICQSQQ